MEEILKIQHNVFLSKAALLFFGLTVGLLVIPMQVAYASSFTVKAGVYEITVKTLLPNLEENLRYTTTVSEQCLSSQDATTLFPVLSHKSFSGCNLVGMPIESKQSQFSLACKNAEAASGTAYITTEHTGFAALLKIKMGGKNMKFSQTVRAHWLKACDD